MAIEVTYADQLDIGYADGGTVGSLGPAIDLDGATLLVVALTLGATPPDEPTFTLAWDGVAMTRCGTSFVGAFSHQMQIWALQNPAAGSKLFTVGGIAGWTPGWLQAQVVGVKGADPDAPIGAHGEASSADGWVGSLDVSVDVTDAGSALFSFIRHVFAPDSGQSAPVGWSELHARAVAQGIAFDAYIKMPSGSTGEQGFTFTNTPDPVPSDIHAVEILAAPDQDIDGVEVIATFSLGGAIVGQPQDIEGVVVEMTMTLGAAVVSPALSLLAPGIAMTMTLGAAALIYDQELHPPAAVATFGFGAGLVVTAARLTAPAVVATFSLGFGGVGQQLGAPLTLAPGQSVGLRVAFLPTGQGLRTGSLTVASNAPDSPRVIPLSGVGLTAEAQTLTAPPIAMTMTPGAPVVSNITAAPMTYLTADGAKLRDAAGQQVMLRSINWYGFEQAFMPHGLWMRPYKTITVDGVVQEGILDMVKRLGFNSIRLLFCQDVTDPTVDVNTPNGLQDTYTHPQFNPDLFINPTNKPWYELTVMPQPIIPSIQVMDKIVEHCGTLGLRIILDMHCLAPDDDNVLATNGKWYTTATPSTPGGTSHMARTPRSEAQAIAAWVAIAERYAGNPVVCGADLINEPATTTWDDDPLTGLPAYYERVGAAIQAVNPDILIVCEGIMGNVNHCPPGFEAEYENTNGFYEWGTIWSGKLDVVRDRPVELPIPNKIVYSPHEYGSWLGGSGVDGIAHQWFNPKDTMPFYAGLPFPDNMFEVWRRQWGWMAEEDLYPVWIGEFGADLQAGGVDWFVVNGDGSVTHNVFDPDYTATHRDLDFAWLSKLAQYCNAKDIGFAWWSLNPGTVGGIVQMDWKTTLEFKYEHLLDQFVFHEGPFTAPVQKQTSPNFSTYGNQIIDSLGRPARFRACSWFGFETPARVPQGLWQERYIDILAQMKGWGFDTIRFPFSGDLISGGGHDALSASNYVDLQPLTPVQILDKLIDTCAAMDLKVQLVMYGRVSGGGFGGDPVTVEYPLSWLTTFWEAIATRYASKPNVIAFDPFEEPNTQWADWKPVIEHVANAVHAIAPGWLVQVEGSAPPPGVFDFFAGEYLVAAGANPVTLTVPNKVVYTPHVYAHSVYLMSYLQTPSHTVPGWPDNLYTHFRESWGYLFEENIAPVWPTEFGGWFGIDSDGNPTKPYGTEETQWGQALVKYLNGDFDGDATRDLAAGKKGMSFSYWGWSPYGGDTGGLVEFDLVTPIAAKLTLLGPLLEED